MSDLDKTKSIELKEVLLDDAEYEDEEEDEYDEEGEEEEEDDEIEVDTELFAEQVLRFSCFSDAPKGKDADELFDLIFAAYEDENLTEEQDHTVEFLLHIQEEESPFNLSRALEVWNKDDRALFLSLVKEISDSIDD
ncbi:MAG: hypothetical protein H7249_10015 [Chitinophagaceae bacterium]|nr:hypothetical protein [Oligoflexus sp.]